MKMRTVKGSDSIPKGRYSAAVGFRYESGVDNAPIIEVSEEGPLADEVVRLAHRFGVPVVEKPELVDALSRIPLDSQIPPELYEAVAIVLHELSHRKSSVF